VYRKGGDTGAGLGRQQWRRQGAVRASLLAGGHARLCLALGDLIEERGHLSLAKR
jgi:hypothetical protein